MGINNRDFNKNILKEDFKEVNSKMSSSVNRNYLEECKKYEFQNNQLNDSVYKTLKTSQMLMILTWFIIALMVFAFIFSILSPFLMVLLFSFGITSIVSTLIGIQYIRKQKVSEGVCIILFGGLTFGIWPFLVASQEIKNCKENKFEFSYASIEYKESMLKSFIIARVIYIIGICTLIFGIGFFIIGIGLYFSTVQYFRKDNLLYGTVINLFGCMSLGIWPLIDSFIQIRKLNSELYEMKNK